MSPPYTAYTAIIVQCIVRVISFKMRIFTSLGLVSVSHTPNSIFGKQAPSNAQCVFIAARIPQHNGTTVTMVFGVHTLAQEHFNILYLTCAVLYALPTSLHYHAPSFRFFSEAWRISCSSWLSVAKSYIEYFSLSFCLTYTHTYVCTHI